ncbi:NAD(+) synthase [Treponema vincentii]|uniref:NAD(+) synthase n=1 Tax=Treponema TaxID=157 RepID=UPI001BAFA807|nr:NAD(+) synthase [Treponema vincentii]QUY18660.1 NAD(+) synthase [Treponema vincentii]
MNIHDYGFYRVAAVVSPCAVGDCAGNAERIISALRKSAEMGADIAVFPALALTTSSCGTLFGQRSLLNAAEDRLEYIVRQTSMEPIIGVLGFPFFFSGNIYSAVAVFSRGTIYGIVPLDGTVHSRVFSIYDGREPSVILTGLQNTAVPFGSDLLFEVEKSRFSFVIGSEKNARNQSQAENKNTSPAADNTLTVTGSALYIEPLAQASFAGSFTELCRSAAARSKQERNTVLFVNAGWGESTTDTACAGERGIYENGELLAAANGFELSTFNKTSGDFNFSGYEDEAAITLADMDCEAPSGLGRSPSACRRIVIPTIPSRGVLLVRPRNPNPFIPLAVQNNEQAWESFFSQVIELQGRGLAKRMYHTGCTKTVLGISGGLDSTLALFISVLASRMLRQKPDSVTAITMPGFGTTDRTKSNALKLAELLGCTALTIPIEKAMMQHFADIGHPTDLCNTVYENAQARERTQILMDKANQLGALLVGTGDLSESALGWETYNGDHMSMYNVNAGIPKTLLRHCIRYVAAYPTAFLPDADKHTEFYAVVQDILDTPISPELLPAQKQIITQKTEDILGPYELHDFFLYYILHTDFSPAKILLLAEHCFSTEQRYNRQQILGCMRIFYRRLFSQQFKRSCAPDGVQVGFGSFSPRGIWQMPSDMNAAVWIAELEKLSEV